MVHFTMCGKVLKFGILAALLTTLVLTWLTLEDNTAYSLLRDKVTWGPKPKKPTPSAPTPTLNDLHAEEQTESDTTIPNIVHYVWLTKDSSAELRFTFLDFLSIYSSHYHFSPSQIYVHTDALPSVMEQALSPSASRWTRLIFSLPTTTLAAIDVPRYVPGRQPPRIIDPIQHRTDFARAQLLREYGGTYLDFDVYPIRDMAELRNSGYRNVLGWEKYEHVNCGVFLAASNTSLIRRWEREMCRVYDGGWTTHVNIIVTKLAKIMRLEDEVEEMAIMASAGDRYEDGKGKESVGGGNGEGKEILILPETAFHYMSWEGQDRENLYAPHTSCVFSAPASIPPPDDSWMHISGDAAKTEDWEIDWKDSYAIHAFEIDSSKEFGAEITAEYVFARQSNFARALWPALKDALAKGVLSWDDVKASSGSV